MKKGTCPLRARPGVRLPPWFRARNRSRPRCRWRSSRPGARGLVVVARIEADLAPQSGEWLSPMGVGQGAGALMDQEPFGANRGRSGGFFEQILGEVDVRA